MKINLLFIFKALKLLRSLTNAIMDFENPMQIPTSFSYGDFKDAFAAVENIANHQKEDLPFDPREIKKLVGI